MTPSGQLNQSGFSSILNFFMSVLFQLSGSQSNRGAARLSPTPHCLGCSVALIKRVLLTGLCLAIRLSFAHLLEDQWAIKGVGIHTLLAHLPVTSRGRATGSALGQDGVTKVWSSAPNLRNHDTTSLAKATQSRCHLIGDGPK